jgi:hypothetical protein
MKTHTANYQNTLIAIADDSPATSGEIPPVKGDKKSVANIQYDMISKNPYKFTSDDVLFYVYAERNDLADSELEKAREAFFSKGQPCLRASPLTKRYGWGVHNDGEGKVALVSSDSEAYQKLSEDKAMKVVKAMKSSR